MEWNNNVESLLCVLEAVQGGVRGQAGLQSLSIREIINLMDNKMFIRTNNCRQIFERSSKYLNFNQANPKTP